MSLIQSYVYGVASEGTSASLYKTEDTGQTWTEITSFAPFIFVDGNWIYGTIHAHKYNHNKLFFAGSANSGEPRLVRSFNGGASAAFAGGNWATVATGDFTDSSLLGTGRCRFSSADESNIYLIGSSYLYKSEDNGLTFNYVGSLNNVLSTTVDAAEYRDVFFANVNVGIISIGDNVYTTGDAGTTWTALPTLPAVSNIASAIIDETGLAINLLAGLNVYKSDDGGVTWATTVLSGVNPIRFTPCLDNPETLTLENGHLSGSATIYRSVDFGATWTTVTSLQTPNIAFFNNNCASTGVGYSTSVLMSTVNGGISFTLTGTAVNRYWHATAASYTCGCPPDSVLYNGQCITGDPDCCFPDSTDTNKLNCECYSSDPIPCCFELTPCVGEGSTIYTNSTLTPGIDNYAGQVVKLEGSDECYEVIVTEAICEAGVAVVIEESFADCYNCNPVYMLTSCDENPAPEVETPVYTNQPVFADYLGQVVWLNAGDNPKFATCYFVGVGPFDADLSVLPEPAETFEDCESCGYYLLTNCLDDEDVLYSIDTTLSTYVGLVGSYNDNCYSVTFVQGYISETFIDNPFTENPYEDCECCTYIPPEPEFKKYERVIPEPVREFYRIAQSKCEIDTNVKYGVGWYSEFMRLKQGINMCVDVDLDKLWMKYKLQEFSMIYDESLCTTATTPDTPADCIEPTGWIPFE